MFRGERAVIPNTLRADLTRRIHSSHLGVEGRLRRARECVYWQGMNEQIKTFISKCDICRSLDPKQQKETLHHHDITYRPWAKVGTDLFSWHNKDYLITVDYYSNFWEVYYLLDTKSTTVIRKVKAHFTRQGIPDVLILDNGPQYSSRKFEMFSQRWEFEHRTSSPGHPQSNGMAESAVKSKMSHAESCNRWKRSILGSTGPSQHTEPRSHHEDPDPSSCKRNTVGA